MEPTFISHSAEMIAGKPNHSPFFEEVILQIAAGERVCILAKSGDMLPFIREGRDEVVLERLTDKSLKRGNIVLAQLKNGTFVIRRIERISGDCILLRADGDIAVRQSCIRTHVLAEIVAVVRGGNTFWKRGFLWNCIRLLWPSNVFLRHVLLSSYKLLLSY